VSPTSLLTSYICLIFYLHQAATSPVFNARQFVREKKLVWKIGVDRKPHNNKRLVVIRRHLSLPQPIYVFAIEVELASIFIAHVVIGSLVICPGVSTSMMATMSMSTKESTACSSWLSG
jgi:hypothetical protein